MFRLCLVTLTIASAVKAQQCTTPQIDNGIVWSWGYGNCQYLRPGGAMKPGTAIDSYVDIYIGCQPGYTADYKNRTDSPDCRIVDGQQTYDKEPIRCVPISEYKLKRSTDVTQDLFQLNDQQVFGGFSTLDDLSDDECEQIDSIMNEMKEAIFDGNVTGVYKLLSIGSRNPLLPRALNSPTFFDGETYIRRSAIGLAIIQNEDSIGVPIIRMLIDAGAYPDAKGEYGDSLINLAIEWKRLGAMLELIVAGVDVNSRGMRRDTLVANVMSQACWEDPPATMLQILLARGAKVTTTTMTRYVCSIGRGKDTCGVESLRMARQLLDKAKSELGSAGFREYMNRKDLECDRRQGLSSALDVAVREDFDDLAQLLRAYGATH